MPECIGAGTRKETNETDSPGHNPVDCSIRASVAHALPDWHPAIHTGGGEVRHISTKQYHPKPDNNWTEYGTPVRRLKQNLVARRIARRIAASHMQSTAAPKATNHTPNLSTGWTTWHDGHVSAIAYDKECDRVQAFTRNVAHQHIVQRLLIDSLGLRKDGKPRTRRIKPVKATVRRVESPMMVDRSTDDIESAMQGVDTDIQRFITLCQAVPASELTGIGEPMPEGEVTNDVQ